VSRVAPSTKITSDARILIVDDDAHCASGLEQLLKRTGYTACTAITCPSIAVERFSELKPDLILLDLHMYPLSGMDVLKKINEMTEPRSRPPVIMLTADTTVEAKHEALAAGATAFLAKPFDLIEVILRIENLLTNRDLFLRCQNYSESLEHLLDTRTEELKTADLGLAIAELRDTQRRVIQQERMRALGTMAAGIAHDLNNGLYIILCYGDLLLRDSTTFPSGSRARDSLEKIVLAGRDNAELVKRLGAFHRPSDTPESREAIDLNQLIDESISLTEPRWKSEPKAGNGAIQIKRDLGEIPMIAGVPAELREVLTNLIFNAVDAMPEGGCLCISTRGERGRVRLQVSDTGAGMTEETLHKCFEPFFTTKGERGSGLGLAMSHGIIRRHNGTITVESSLNKGTAFTVFLPVSTAVSPVNGDRVRKRPLEAIPSRNKTGKKVKLSCVQEKRFLAKTS
jgi:signal transduction histidine kinase